MMAIVVQRRILLYVMVMRLLDLDSVSFAKAVFAYLALRSYQRSFLQQKLVDLVGERGMVRRLILGYN